MGALVGIVWDAFWLVGPPLGLVSASDRTWFLFWGLVAVAVCGFQAFLVLIGENRLLKQTLDDRNKFKKAKELIGQMLELLSHCEIDAYEGSNHVEYEKLLEEIDEVKRGVRDVATKYLDLSFESRFLAVNVLDVHLDEPTRMHFITRAQGNFWTMYQQIKGWRAYLNEVLKELKDR
jgi:hypothetical protein